MTEYADAAELWARMVDRLSADDLAGWAAQIAPWLPALATVPRRLWDEVDTAHQWWIDHGKPEPARWCVTVSLHTQHIDLTEL